MSGSMLRSQTNATAFNDVEKIYIQIQYSAVVTKPFL